MVAEKYLKRIKQEPKPIDEWTPEEWEVAYNALSVKHDKLRDILRRALQCLNSAV